MRSAVERFWTKVDRKSNAECWVWSGAKVHGYGYFFLGRLDGKNTNTYAHRFAYQLLIGPIPKQLTIDHLCRNRSCVNPAHMEPVSQGLNTVRGSTKTHCKRGHELTQTNRYKRGECVQCSKLRYREGLTHE